MERLQKLAKIKLLRGLLGLGGLGRVCVWFVSKWVDVGGGGGEEGTKRGVDVANEGPTGLR